MSNRSYTQLTLTKGHLYFDGIWIIATQAELSFSIVLCKPVVASAYILLNV